MQLIKNEREKMKIFRLLKEQGWSKIQNENVLKIEAKNIENVKSYLLKNGYEFIRYSQFSNTVYYKNHK